MEFHYDNFNSVSHRRITSGDDIIAYSYVEDFLNYLNVNHAIDSVRNREDRNINIVKVGMNNQIFDEVSRRLNLEFRNECHVVEMRNVRGIGIRTVNCAKC